MHVLLLHSTERRSQFDRMLEISRFSSEMMFPEQGGIERLLAELRRIWRSVSREIVAFLIPNDPILNWRSWLKERIVSTEDRVGEGWKLHAMDCQTASMSGVGCDQEAKNPIEISSTRKSSLR